MPAVPIIASIAAAAAVGGSVYQGIEANKARKEAEAAANEQARLAKESQDNLLKEQKDNQNKMASEQAAKQSSDDATASATASREAARKRQASLRTGAGSRQSTILTSPLGDTSVVPVASKTLLGV